MDGFDDAGVVPDILRLPKQTTHPARRRRIRETNVIQNPGPGEVVTTTFRSRSSDFTRPKSAMSIANAIKVSNAAKNDSNDATSNSFKWANTLHSNATNATPVATG